MYQCLNPVVKTLVSLFGCVASYFHDSNALLEKSTFLKLENKVCMCGVVA